ncbi:MAG: hypothetical protein M3Y80_08060, partial [Verrucomicrobiota bacterium]|nr:hypothetical protein [Verrucomicrobiota bacterium]
ICGKKPPITAASTARRAKSRADMANGYHCDGHTAIDRHRSESPRAEQFSAAETVYFFCEKTPCDLATIVDYTGP